MKIRQMQYPVFCKGNLPYDSKGRNEVVAYQCSIECGGVEVHPGDLVFADVDGVVVIPQAIADKVIERALQKVQSENQVRAAILSGMSLAEAFQKYNVL